MEGNVTGKVAALFFLVYGIVGTVLFSTFLPWT